MGHSSDCIFFYFFAGEVPSRKVYEVDDIYVFHVLSLCAPVHFLLFLKRHIPSLAQLESQDAELMGKIMTLAPKLALEQGCHPYPEGGFRIMVNVGDHGGQEVHHLHVHVMGGPRPWARG